MISDFGFRIWPGTSSGEVVIAAGVWRNPEACMPLGSVEAPGERRYGGPKALHKPARGKRGTSAALGIGSKNNKALKGRGNVRRPFRALILEGDDPRALPWAGLLRAFGPKRHRRSKCLAGSHKSEIRNQKS